jgi:protein-S-isoprenylcysteine O-methyltransferase Ste14
MTSELPPRNDLRRLLTYQLVASLFFMIVIPISISWPSGRHGWSQHSPGIANLFGLVPLLAGFAITIWANVEHVRNARRHGWRSEMVRFEASQYLIEGGPYRYTRNPIYVSHLLIWSGWAIFFGSVTVAVAAVLIWISLALVILPYEERRLKEKFGTSYESYNSRAPRWLGRPSYARGTEASPVSNRR